MVKEKPSKALVKEAITFWMRHLRCEDLTPEEIEEAMWNLRFWREWRDKLAG